MEDPYQHNPLPKDPEAELPHWESHAAVRVLIFFLLIVGLELIARQVPQAAEAAESSEAVLTGGAVVFMSFMTHGIPALLMLAACARIVPSGRRLEAWGFTMTVPGLPAAALMRAVPLVVLVAAMGTAIRYGAQHFFDLDLPGSLEGMLEGANRDLLIGFAISAIVIAPIAEEMFFRQVLHGAFLQRMSERYADVLTSAIFAAVHMDAVGLIPLFIVGYALQRIRKSSGSLALPILTHAFFNAIMLTYSIWQLKPE